MELVELVPSAPALLAHTTLEVGTVGGTLWVAAPVDGAPRPRAFTAQLATELQGFLQRHPDPEEVQLVAQVVGALGLADPELALEPRGAQALLAA
jgi:hypothetical protein